MKTHARRDKIGRKKLIKEEMETHEPQIPSKRKSLEEGISTFFSNPREGINLNLLGRMLMGVYVLDSCLANTQRQY